MNNYVKHAMKTKKICLQCIAIYNILRMLLCATKMARIPMLVMTHGITHVHVPVWYDLTVARLM